MLAYAARYLAQLAVRIQTFPTTFCHGDCHIGNLLHDADNHLIWADWQEAGIGHGPCDVSFFVQRAIADGGSVPESALLEAYHAELVAAVGTPISLSSLRQVMDTFELQTRLLHWPAYLAMESDNQILAHLARIDDILTRA